MQTTARSHTKQRVAFAPRIRAEDLSVERDAREVWRAITSDPSIAGRINNTPIAWKLYRLRRKDVRNDPLTLLAELAIGLANAGLPEGAARRIPLFLSRVIDDCYVGNAHRNIDELDRAAQSLEYAENQLQLERRIDGHATPDELDAEATAIEAETALEIERARELRRRARMARNGMGIAR